MVGYFVNKAPWLWKVKGQRSPKCSDQWSLVLFSTHAENLIKMFFANSQKNGSCHRSSSLGRGKKITEKKKSKKRSSSRSEAVRVSRSLEAYTATSWWGLRMAATHQAHRYLFKARLDRLLKCCKTERATCYCSPTNGGKAGIFCKTSQAVFFSPSPTALVFIADTLPLLHSAY